MVAFVLVSCDSQTDAEAGADEVDAVSALAEERKKLDETLYAKEVDAQRYEQTFVKLWDDLRAGEAFGVFKKFEFGELVLGTPKAQADVEWGVKGIRGQLLGTPFKEPLDPAGWGKMLDFLQQLGVKVLQTEWHHAQFMPATGDQPPKSLVSFEIHTQIRNSTQPMLIRGTLDVEWPKDGKAVPARITTKDVQMIGRKGPPMFVEALTVDPVKVPPRRYPRVSPVLLHDLNGDGRSEIVAAGSNLVYWNRGNFRFEHQEFLKNPIIPPAEGGLLADVTGDGVVDYLSGNRKSGEVLLFVGGRGGSFDGKPIVCFDQKLQNLHTITAGDIDRDGDLDLFLGQWKEPYAGGTMPTPYYDANDGYPDYLLVNDGKGRFSDGTAAAGLDRLQNRRTFSASFVDFNGDDHLDLAVVADFSGLDLYHNQGDGTFKDVTATLGKERYSFGMSHTFDDWNRDGVLDLYMVGMSSTTARRLDGLGLGRPGYEKYTEMRAPMTFGNRLLLGKPGGEFSQSPLAASAARTGWAWGCTSADFDLDGDADLYVANGHLSGDSAKDYCTRFWCHDLYTGNSEANPVLDKFYMQELGLKLGTEFSWNGFEHNALFLNQPEEGFFNASALLGVAFEYDSRAVVSDDLDGDGRPDLLVVEYSTQSKSQQLHVYRNQYESGNDWIGLRVLPPSGESVHGATVSARVGEFVWKKAVVTGDSFTAQHAPTVHFGLGTGQTVQSLTVRWPSGKETVLEQPEKGRYHSTTP